MASRQLPQWIIVWSVDVHIVPFCCVHHASSDISRLWATLIVHINREAGHFLIGIQTTRGIAAVELTAENYHLWRHSFFTEETVVVHDLFFEFKEVVNLLLMKRIMSLWNEPLQWIKAKRYYIWSSSWTRKCSLNCVHLDKRGLSFLNQQAQQSKKYNSNDSFESSCPVRLNDPDCTMTVGKD